MIHVAVFGYGNVGQNAVAACEDSGDMRLVGVVSRTLAARGGDYRFAVAASEEGLPAFEVAILAQPTRQVEETALRLLGKGIRTVDSFDVHGEIPALRARLDTAAKASGAAAIISAGWDPGSDSVVRALMEAITPRGVTYTNFGPGMSMGHSVAVKAIPGVRDGLSLTIPLGTGIHRRLVYVELESGASLAEVTAAIKADPYFARDETHVAQVDSVRALMDMGHGVAMERKGVSSGVHNQLLSFNMKVNNPALTAQVMCAAARAVTRQSPGCYTLIEVPPVDLLPMPRDEAVARLV